MSDFVMYLFESGICLALFYSIYWLFLKKETFFNLNRFFLISSILFSFIVPFVKIPSSITSGPIIERAYFFTQSVGSSSQSLGVFDVILGVYAFGTGFLLLRFSFQLIKVFILIKKNGVHKYNGFKVVFIEKNCSPFSFFNFIFINKSNISGDDLQRIIAHEMIHIRQYHSIDLIVLELLAIFQWFNPFVWPYKKSLKETHEYLADYAVIAQGCSAAKYQLLIVEQHVGAKLFELANNFNQSQIKRRITMITKNKSKRWAKLKILLILPMLCFLILAFADSQTVREPDQAVQMNEENVVPTQEEAQSWTVQADQKKKEDEKKKLEKAKQIDMTIKELEVKYNKTDDPELKKRIKEKIADLMKQRENLDSTKFVKIYVVPDVYTVKADVGTDVDVDKVKSLKDLYEKTDDPEKKKQIEKKIEELQKNIQVDSTKYVKVDVGKDVYVVKADVGVDVDVDKMNNLRTLYEKTDDPEKKKLIKQKIQELEKKKQLEDKKNIEMAIKELEKKYEETDDAELKKKIKEKIEQLRKRLKK